MELVLTVSFIVSVQVRILPLNMRHIITYVARWWERYLSKRSLIKHTCSWRDKLTVLWTLKRQAKMFLRILVLLFFDYIGSDVVFLRYFLAFKLEVLYWRKRIGKSSNTFEQLLIYWKIQVSRNNLQVCKVQFLICFFKFSAITLSWVTSTTVFFNRCYSYVVCLPVLFSKRSSHLLHSSYQA